MRGSPAESRGSQPWWRGLRHGTSDQDNRCNQELLGSTGGTGLLERGTEMQCQGNLSSGLVIRRTLKMI